MEPERFWTKVERRGESECWLWLAAKDQDGYGFYWHEGRYTRAHRFAYELLIEPIEPGLQIDHLCRTPGCVNPRHMEQVTSRENTLRGHAPTALNAAKTHCQQGHEFTPENTLLDKHGGRHCRTCNLERWHRWKRRKRAHEQRVGKEGRC